VQNRGAAKREPVQRSGFDDDRKGRSPKDGSVLASFLDYVDFIPVGIVKLRLLEVDHQFELSAAPPANQQVSCHAKARHEKQPARGVPAAEELPRHRAARLFATLAAASTPSSCVAPAAVTPSLERQQWLERAVEALRERFAEAGYTVPRKRHADRLHF
jgi:hypothetical protein